MLDAHHVGVHGKVDAAGEAAATAGGPRAETAAHLRVNVGGAVDRAAVVRVVFGAIAVAVLAMVALHLLGAGRLNPATTTVSDYVSLPGGALLLAIAVLAVALATAAVPVGLLRAGLPGKVCWPFGLGCAGLVATIAFPTNALGTAESPATVLHRYAAGVFFVSLPVAALMVLRQLPNRLVRLGTAVSVVAGVLFLVSHIPLLLPDWPGAHEIADVLPRGLAERALLTVDIALLGTLALATRSTSKPGAVR